MDKLSNFVHEQIKSGANPAELKSHLLQNGWSESDVDSAINSATGKTLRNRIIIAVVGIVIVGILALVLVSLAKNATPPQKTPMYTPPTTPVNTLNPQTPVSGGCMDKESSVEKDECYKQMIKAGYDCKKLTEEIELVYCNRAYEDLSLKGVEQISEN